eukprot:8426591-Pyramimonas_sp.AAC.1
MSSPHTVSKKGGGSSVGHLASSVMSPLMLSPCCCAQAAHRTEGGERGQVGAQGWRRFGEGGAVTALGPAVYSRLTVLVVDLRVTW